ncbi:MAG: 4,5-DOPA dioxygenase extradiol [Chloroflexi bacterium]|nr:4,5-DOPA dioxygenase extradiol [Chloroflexota bacterium]
MSEKMPVLFVGHGSPMNAIEENEFGRAWTDMGKQLPRPKAILAVSAHWETMGTKVTAMEKPKTIYDFYGFPKELYEVTYPAPGSPDLVQTVRKIIKMSEVQPDLTWGLDHGTWSVLHRMFPAADIPVVQLSLDRAKSPQQHYQLGQQLKELREEGVVIISSGNIVHNLRMVVFDDKLKFEWAESFDKKVSQWILDDDHDPIIQFEKQGHDAQLAINSAEHYLPLLYTLGLKDEGEPVSFFADKVTYGSLSMRSVKVG